MLMKKTTFSWKTKKKKKKLLLDPTQLRIIPKTNHQISQHWVKYLESFINIKATGHEIMGKSWKILSWNFVLAFWLEINTYWRKWLKFTKKKKHTKNVVHFHSHSPINYFNSINLFQTIWSELLKILLHFYLNKLFFCCIFVVCTTYYSCKHSNWTFSTYYPPSKLLKQKKKVKMKNIFKLAMKFLEKSCNGISFREKRINVYSYRVVSRHMGFLEIVAKHRSLCSVNYSNLKL